MGRARCVWAQEGAAGGLETPSSPALWGCKATSQMGTLRPGEVTLHRKSHTLAWS